MSDLEKYVGKYYVDDCNQLIYILRISKYSDSYFDDEDEGDRIVALIMGEYGRSSPYVKSQDLDSYRELTEEQAKSKFIELFVLYQDKIKKEFNFNEV